ncbi:MAG: hypothetical protein U1A77_18790 [Pirellulales bacterium]
MANEDDRILPDGSGAWDGFLAIFGEELASASPGDEVTVAQSSVPLELTPDPQSAALGDGLCAVDVLVKLGGTYETSEAATAAAHAASANLVDRLRRIVPLTLGWRIQFQSARLAGEMFVELADLDEGRLDAMLME